MKKTLLLVALFVVTISNINSQDVKPINIFNTNLLFKYDQKTFMFDAQLEDVVFEDEVKKLVHGYVIRKHGTHNYYLYHMRYTMSPGEEGIKMIKASNPLYSCKGVEYRDKSDGTWRGRIMESDLPNSYSFTKKGGIYYHSSNINFHLNPEGFLFLNFDISYLDNEDKKYESYIYVLEYDKDNVKWNILHSRCLYYREYFDYQQLSYDREKGITRLEAYGTNNGTYYEFEIKNNKLSLITERYANSQSTR